MGNKIVNCDVPNLIYTYFLLQMSFDARPGIYTRNNNDQKFDEIVKKSMFRLGDKVRKLKY